MDLANQDVNYYELLLVSRSAPVEIIQASYRTLMQKLKHHPDLGGDTDTATLINEAYAVLCDPRRRAEHDAHLDALARSDPGTGSGARRPTPAGSGRTAAGPLRACLFCATNNHHPISIAKDLACIVCNSPLFPAENHRLEPTGQRAVARIDKRQEITFFTQWPQAIGLTGQTEDISLNGMRFVTSAELVQGQYIKIVSRIADAIAQVANFSPTGGSPGATNVAGVSFVTLRFNRSQGAFVTERA
jgi:curved DNA-binding protein CbpA